MITWLDRISPQLTIVWQGKWTAGQQEPARYLYDHELVFVTQGSCEVRLNETAVTLRTGDFLIVPPDTVHVTTTGAGGVERFCFHFDWLPAEKAAPHPFCCFYPARPPARLVTPAPSFIPKGILHGTCSDLKTVRQLLQTLVPRWQSDQALSLATCRALFLELLTRLLWQPTREKPATDRGSQLAHAVKELLDRPESGGKSIQTLLTTLGFSYPHLCRQFHRSFGVTPAEYRNAVRLERAKTLLRDPKCSIGEAAYAAGFQDPGYFTRVFRRQNGAPPSAFR